MPCQKIRGKEVGDLGNGGAVIPIKKARIRISGIYFPPFEMRIEWGSFARWALAATSEHFAARNVLPGKFYCGTPRSRHSGVTAQRLMGSNGLPNFKNRALPSAKE